MMMDFATQMKIKRSLKVVAVETKTAKFFESNIIK